MYNELLVKGIENFDKKIEDYARLIVKGGVRFQKGWALVIDCPVVCPDLARACAKVAYEEGACDVTISWRDPYVINDKFANCEEAYLDNESIWPDDARQKYENQDIAFIVFMSDSKAFHQNISMDRAIIYNKYISKLFESFKRGLEIPYTICGAACQEWAQDVFPDLSPDDAYIKLWNNLFEIARVDGKSDPVENWLQHCDEVGKYAQILNDYNFHHLHFTSEIGTDVTFNLPKDHIWIATAENTSSGKLTFSANIPTEEVFCIPEKNGVNGKIVCDKSFVTKIGVIEKPSFVLKDGKIIEFSAESGEELFKALMDSDPNGRFLGEVALVPYDTPISLQHLTYYNPLYDENSGCHTAIGNAYSKCLKGGLQMTPEELEANNLNVCNFHEDCVFGTAGTNIVGTTYDGKNIQIFENGAFVI